MFSKKASMFITDNLNRQCGGGTSRFFERVFNYVVHTIVHAVQHVINIFFQLQA